MGGSGYEVKQTREIFLGSDLFDFNDEPVRSNFAWSEVIRTSQKGGAGVSRG